MAKKRKVVHAPAVTPGVVLARLAVSSAVSDALVPFSPLQHILGDKQRAEVVVPMSQEVADALLRPLGKRSKAKKAGASKPTGYTRFCSERFAEAKSKVCVVCTDFGTDTARIVTQPKSLPQCTHTHTRTWRPPRAGGGCSHFPRAWRSVARDVGQRQGSF